MAGILRSARRTCSQACTWEQVLLRHDAVRSFRRVRAPEFQRAPTISAARGREQRGVPFQEGGKMSIGGNPRLIVRRSAR